MLKIARNNFLQILFRNKESPDSEQTCDTYNTYDGADGVGMVDNNVSWNRKDKNLQDIRGSKVDKHAYKFKTDYYAEYTLEEVLAVGKMRIYL